MQSLTRNENTPLARTTEVGAVQSQTKAQAQHSSVSNSKKLPSELPTLDETLNTKLDGARYRNKYNAVHTIFQTAPRSLDDSPVNAKEDRLFRKLAEAFINCNTESFDKAYMERVLVSRDRFNRVH